MSNLIENIRRSTRTIVRELKVLRGPREYLGMSLSQCHFLFELQQKSPQNLQQLADTLVLDKSTTSRLSNSLAKKGFIDTIIPEHDQRQKQYLLTDTGKKAVQKSNQRANNQVHEALNLLSSDEQQKVLEGMSLYAKALRQQRLQKRFRIRLIQANDNPQVAQIIRKVMTEFGAVGPGYSINDPEVDDMYGAYQHERARFFVIEDERNILGCGGIGPLANGGSDVCELKKMYFDSGLRGVGMGKKLLKHCLVEAKKLGYQTCYLETVARMWQAVRLYEKAGFKKLDGPMGNTGHSSCETYFALDLSAYA